MVGTVEDVERGYTKSFSDAGELWRMLQRYGPEDNEEDLKDKKQAINNKEEKNE